MDDLISRQAAIDALDVLCQEHRYKIPGKRETYSQYNEAWQDALDRAEGAIFNLPSAQTEPCEDAVSRHRLLSDLEELIVAWEKYPVMAEQRKGVEVAIGYVKTIPGAQPTIEERKKGEWIYNSPVTMKCNQCGLVIKDWDWHRFKYCPNCDAKMEGAKDG